MWILPTNHPKYSAYAAACVASKEESSELLANSMLLLMWKSKPLSSKTLPRLWNRVYWIPRLFGRILKPSHQQHFTTNYTASLADIPASPLALPESKKEVPTLDTFGRIYSELSKQQTLFGASSKMLPDTYNWDLTKFTEAWQIWVTQLRQESLQRRKLAHHTKENASLSSQWQTPISTLYKNGKSSHGYGQNLNEQVTNNWPTPDTQNSRDGKHLRSEFTGNKHSLSLHHAVYLENINWPTPRTNENFQGHENLKNMEEAESSWKGQGRGATLSTAIQMWPTPMSLDFGGSTMEDHSPKLSEVAKMYPTPAATDYKGSGKTGVGRDRLDYVVERKIQKGVTLSLSKGGHLAPDPTSTHGKPHGLLNPAWVAQLMGTTLEKTFFACTETELLSKPQPSPG